MFSLCAYTSYDAKRNRTWSLSQPRRVQPISRVRVSRLFREEFAKYTLRRNAQIVDDQILLFDSNLNFLSKSIKLFRNQLFEKNIFFNQVKPIFFNIILLLNFNTSKKNIELIMSLDRGRWELLLEYPQGGCLKFFKKSQKKGDITSNNSKFIFW